jgi:CBS domain-containing protein
MAVKLVRDLMQIGVTTCGENTPLVEAARTLLHEQLESLIVLNEHGHAVGMLTRPDVVTAFGRSAASTQGHEPLTVSDVMQPNILEIPADIPAAAAAQMMIDQGVREAYLLHHDGGIGWPAAVFRFDDVLRYLAGELEI